MGLLERHRHAQLLVAATAPARVPAAEPGTTAPEQRLEEVAEVEAILKPLGIEDSSLDWRKMISGQRLWYFESRDANAWLMI